MRQPDDPLPVLGIARTVLLPGMACAVPLITDGARGAIEEAMRTNGEVAVFAVHAGAPSRPEPTDHYTTGTLARVIALGTCARCRRQVVKLQGVHRVRAFVFVSRVSDPYLHVICARPEKNLEPEDDSLRSVAAAVWQTALEIRRRFPQCRAARRAVEDLRGRCPEEIPGAASALLGHLSVPEKQSLLETDPLSLRLLAVRHELRRCLATTRGAVHHGWESRVN